MMKPKNVVVKTASTRDDHKAHRKRRCISVTQYYNATILILCSSFVVVLQQMYYESMSSPCLLKEVTTILPSYDTNQPNTSKIILGVDRVKGMVDEKFQLYDDDVTQMKLERLSFQFPSVEQRIKYYMGSWYRYKHFDWSLLCKEIPFFSPDYPGNPADFVYIYNKSNIEDFPINNYIPDVKNNIILHASDPSTFRMISKLGDEQVGTEWPIFIKSRRVDAPEDEISILVLLNERRHYPTIPFKAALYDRDWDEKLDSIVWRGATSGKKDRFDLVKKHINDTKDGIDVGFSDFDERFQNDEAVKKFQRNHMEAEDLLKYKYLLSIEGNDVASGLKWMMYSQSVVFMPPPTQETWAMEGLLVPYYHYIPLAPDLSDLKEKLQWARTNDDLCRRIARQSTKYIEDLYVSSEAKKSSLRIHKAIVSRYETFYEEALSKCSPDATTLESNSCQINEIEGDDAEQQTNASITWLMSYPHS
jgi:hypothetical protein